ncbi:hypothetical protein OH720_15670 [Pseudomonas sp. WJP1]|uniref:hypothetical protein n=1 Tax=Pseudomonas sp. WJP1 TaxID=2986947 RepID=UPI00234BB926|nr:hypothetical protein [Pseudomonas sp. WJP1]WCM54383.1 hypothetical protein OH720_15670 [Pseudomonas sp. WJP1]
MMPGFLLHAGATVMCAHGGQAMSTAPFARVLLAGQPVTTLTAPYVVAGCSMPPPLPGNGPCIIGQWLVGATRVYAGGQPVLLQSSTSICTPTGTPLMITATQMRVSGV